MLKMKHPLLPGILLALGVIWGCETNPTDPTNVNDSDLSSKAVQNSAEIYNTVSTVKQVTEVLRGPNAILQVDQPGAQNIGSLSAQAQQVKQHVLRAYQLNQRRSNKVLGAMSDSLIWEITQKDKMAGYTERVRLYYDFDTGKARFEAIKFDFDDRHQIKYDSATVKLDLNKTLDDESDDTIESFEELKQYKVGHHMVEEWARVQLDDYAPGTEPTGGEFDKRIDYAESSLIQQTVEHARLTTDQGGEWSKVVKYNDGTQSSEKVTFTADGKGTFEEVRRFGTRIEGTFDSPEDDGVGSFTKRTTFPEGSDPKSIYETGNFTLDFADSTMHGSFEKTVEFKDGSKLSETVKFDESYENGKKITRLEINQSDGSHGILVIEEGLDIDRVSGEWTDPDGTYTKFKIDYFADGSARLEFQIWESRAAYDRGEDPIVSGMINFNPDGSGEGTVTENGQEQSVTVGPDGSAGGM
ncbi:MAG: hypothetical protein Q9P14_08140 [candidate division KSB1 bacterium]|nr:hypothetical protein [candidate division KSB1 bacterium]MDQ7064367.1 hypothetical protein [candidate division KSB1 bacterium]